MENEVSNTFLHEVTKALGNEIRRLEARIENLEKVVRDTLTQWE